MAARMKKREARFIDPHGCLKTSLDYEGDVGYDLAITKDEVIPADGNWYAIDTGVRVCPPPGFWFELAPRSSALDKGLFISRGIIDAGYRGVLIIRIKCDSRRGVFLRKGERVAQLIAHPIVQMDWKKVEAFKELGESDRGENGFGSTG